MVHYKASNLLLNCSSFFITAYGEVVMKSTLETKKTFVGYDEKVLLWEVSQVSFTYLFSMKSNYRFSFTVWNNSQRISVATTYICPLYGHHWSPYLVLVMCCDVRMLCNYWLLYTYHWPIVASKMVFAGSRAYFADSGGSSAQVNLYDKEDCAEVLVELRFGHCINKCDYVI